MKRVHVHCPRATTCRVVVRTKLLRRHGGHGAHRRGRVPQLVFTIPGGRKSRISISVHNAARPPDRLRVRVSASTSEDSRARRTIRVRLVEHHRPGKAHGKRPPPRARDPEASGVRPLVGVSDQEPSTFTDPLFTALPLVTARLIVPWDVVRTEPGRLEAWLDAARAAGVDPLVAFEHSRGDRCPSDPCRLPAVADYENAVRALIASRPWVRAITPWNEPNHASQPTAGNPRRAADYYDAARKACPNCTLVAGDALDAPGFLGWIAAYRRYLDEEPHVWGLHNYYDATYRQSAGVDGLLASVNGQVWLTETGGIVAYRREDDRVHLPADELRAADGVRRAIALADERSDRVKRVYLYQWRSAPGARFDAGLLDPGGKPRPGYAALRDVLLARSAVAVPPAPVRTGNPRIALTGWPTGRGRTVTLPVSCNPVAGTPCTGRVTVESPSWWTATLINGRAPRWLVPPASCELALAPGLHTSIGLRVDRRRVRRLRVTIAEPDADTAVVVPVVRVR